MRFPEFSGEWEKRKLASIGKFFSGGTPTSSNKDYYDGEIPFIRSGEIHSDHTELSISAIGYENSSAKMVSKGDLLLALYGATSGDIAISRMSGAINQAILCIRTTQDHLFLKSVWEKHVKNILNTYLQGGQGNLSADIVKNLFFYFPGIEEQRKIGRLIELIDQRIAIQNRIIEDLKKLKTALCELLYDESEHNCLIGDLVEQISIRNKQGESFKILSVSNQLGFVEQSEQFEGRTIASQDTSNYKIVSLNDFAYNPARINVGSIAKLKVIEKGIVSPMYVCFRCKDGVLPDYLETFFDTQYFFLEMEKRLEGSVRMCLSFEGLSDIPINLPSLMEQQAIAYRISTLSQKIEIEMKILKKFIQQKKYVLSIVLI